MEWRWRWKKEGGRKVSQNRRTPPSFFFLIGFPDLFLVLRNHTCLSLFILTFPGSPCAMDVPIRSWGGGGNGTGAKICDSRAKIVNSPRTNQKRKAKLEAIKDSFFLSEKSGLWGLNFR